MPTLTSVKYVQYAMIVTAHIKTRAYAGHQRQTDMQPTRKVTRGIMTSTTTSDIKIIEPAKGQWVSGWVTSTQTSSGDLMYGPFETMERAIQWAQSLTSAVVLPVYVATTNQG